MAQIQAAVLWVGAAAAVGVPGRAAAAAVEGAARVAVSQDAAVAVPAETVGVAAYTGVLDSGTPSENCPSTPLGCPAYAPQGGMQSHEQSSVDLCTGWCPGHQLWTRSASQPH